MAVREAVLVIRNIIVEGFNSIFSPKENKYAHYVRYALLAAGLASVGYGGLYLYNWHIVSRESSAHKAFVQCLKDFNSAREGSAPWYDAQAAFQMGYEKHAGSKLAPFFLVFQAEALSQQGNKQEAIVVLKKALNELPASSNLRAVYEVKLAAMKLDSSDENIQKEGLASLEALSCAAGECKDESAGKAVALFYLGSYYWANNEIERSKPYWKKLVALEGEEETSTSAYVREAKEKLKQIEKV